MTRFEPEIERVKRVYILRTVQLHEKRKKYILKDRDGWRSHKGMYIPVVLISVKKKAWHVK